ncbi:MAG: M28 family peptidase [Candidatus Omnitrophota bacterium]
MLAIKSVFIVFIILFTKSIIFALPEGVIVDKLKMHVETLSSEIGERNAYDFESLERARKYITDKFKEYGYCAAYEEYNIDHIPDKKFYNIIAEKKGEAKHNEVIIIGAHYDSCPGTVGADDNATGVSMLLELARVLNKIKFSRTIKFIAFVNEEPPFFKTEHMGSFIYARGAKRRKEKIVYMFALESIGYYVEEKNSQHYPPGLSFFYPDKGNFIAFVSNLGGIFSLKKCANIFRRHSTLPAEVLAAPAILSGVDFSDHWSFWQHNYPGIMITDTAFYRNPYYHTIMDTPETVNYRKLAELFEGLKQVLIELSGKVESKK